MMARLFIMQYLGIIVILDLTHLSLTRSLEMKISSGPFLFVRDNNFIENNSIMGAHTEIVRSKISSNVKISHRTFIADANISENVIIGAGVIFCNFNGEKKCISSISKSVNDDFKIIFL